MPTLRILGGLWLDDGHGRSSGRGAQKRRLALLTFVALSPGRRITRDKALAILWPEATSIEGRRRLSTAIYDLRIMLGGDVIESASDELWIRQASELTTDVEQFESALARGDAEGAVAAYGGPLLDGVHLSGAAEFEEWVASQRERLRRLHVQAIEQVAAARLAAGDSGGAVAAALRLIDLEPLSGRAALVAVNTIASTGDRPHALRIAEAHTARVRRELGVEPDEAVRDIVRRFRVASSARAAGELPADTSPPSSNGTGAAVSEASGSSAPTVPAGAGPAWRRWSLRWRGAAAAGLVIAAIGGAAYRSRAAPAKHESPGPVRVAGLVGVASRSTRSSAALQAFIAGETAYENGRYDAAVKAFQFAVARDSTFALAHYRLGISLLWQEQPAEFAAVHDSLALLFSPSLPLDERVVIRAYVAWRRGQYSLADSLYRSVIARDPTNAEAVFQLAETEFHYNPLRGRSIGEARGWFEHVLLIDSANWGARWHLLLLDAASLSQRNLDARTARLLESQPDGHVAAELRLFAADTNGALSHLAESATAAMLFDAAWRRAVFRRDLTGAESLLRRMMGSEKSVVDQGTAAFAAGAIQVGRGRIRDALPLLLRERRTAPEGDAWALLVHGVLANRADADGTTGLDTLARNVERWRQTLDEFDRPSPTPRVVSGYLRGLIAVARRDTTEAARLAGELDELGSRKDPLMPREFRDPHELAQTVRAYAHFRAGRCEDAVRQLDAERGSYWLGVVASSALATQSFERYIRAECLLALGRNREAVAWFGTFEQNTLYDLEFLSIALRGQAAGYRALGEPAAAEAAERRLTVVVATRTPSTESPGGRR